MTRPSRLLAVLSLALLGSGCVSLLPRQTPVQLYQFGAAAQSAAGAPAVRVGRGERTLGVVLAPVGFPRAAIGDGILTVRGDEAAYVSGGRWLSPATVLFEEAADRTFEARARRVRLVGRTGLAAASAVLRLDVQEFDARYHAGQAAPVMVLSLRASLSRADGRTVLEEVFQAREPASANRISAIVAAFDQATATVLGQVADWTDRETPGLAQGLDPTSPTVPPPFHHREGLDPAGPAG